MNLNGALKVQIKIIKLRSNADAWLLVGICHTGDAC